MWRTQTLLLTLFVFTFQTTLAHIIANQCKATDNSRFVKLSATMCGVNDVKEVIKVAVNERKFKRKTILFMDEIHRFNKLQQVGFVKRFHCCNLVVFRSWKRFFQLFLGHFPAAR